MAEALPEGLLSALRKYHALVSTPQKPGPDGLEQVELGDLMSVLSCIGPSIASKLCEEWKELRKKAKAIGFGFLYGMWWKKFVAYARDNYGVDVTDQEAEESRNDFFNLYPELVTYHDRQKTFARRNGYVRGLQGRKRRLPDAMIEYGPHDRDAKFKKMKRDEAWRQAINSPIQGFASDLNLMVGLAVRKEFPEDKLDIIGVVHDELLIECDEDISEKVIKFVQKTTKWPPLLSKFIDRLTVPLDGSASVGQWGSGIERKEAA